MDHQRLAVLRQVQQSARARGTDPLATQREWQIVGNQYGYGEDALGVPSRTRYHTDDSVEYKYSTIRIRS